MLAKPIRPDFIKKILGFILSWFTLWSALVMLDFLPVMSFWIANSHQATVQDLILPLILSGILSTLVTAIFIYSFRKNRLAALAGSILAILILGQGYNNPIFNFLSKFKNNWGDYFVIIFFLAVIILTYAVTIILRRFISKWQPKTDILALAIVISIAAAFLINSYSLVKILIVEWPQFKYRPPALTSQPVLTETGDKPDIYYIILDRYANQEVLTNQLQFDNSDFIKYLTDNNFSIKPDALSNYPYTSVSISSTLSADYNSDLVKKFSAATKQTLAPYQDAIHYSPVIKQLKSSGYSYYHLGTWYEATNQAPLSNFLYQSEGQLTVWRHTYTLGTFPRQKLASSIFWKIVQHRLAIGGLTIFGYSTRSEIEATLKNIQTLKDLANQSAGGRFIFAHILVPHRPYYFNADGSLSEYQSADNLGEPVQKKYINQIIFINSQIKEIVDNIMKNSQEKAVVIIQSDEGPYPMEMIHGDFDYDPATYDLSRADMRQWSDQDLRMKYGILAAYHLPKADEQSLKAGGDSVNIFRLVLNTYFGENLPYLPKCYYTYPKGRSHPFVYSDITKRLTGQANPACSSDSK